MANNGVLIDPLEEIPSVRSSFLSGPSVSDNKLPEALIFEAKEKSFEEKLYLILYVINNDAEDDISSRSFSVCIGRTMAYSDIKEKLISGIDIDIHRSKVITETKQTETSTGGHKYYLMPYDECISVYAFITSVSTFYSDDEFDIEDYNDGDIPEDNSIKERSYMTREQIEYRNMLEESISRRQFISDMRKIYGPEAMDNNSNNV